MRNRYAICLILLVAVAIRVWYNGYSPDPIVTGDTYGYFLTGKNMLASGRPFFFYISQRPPVYPLFLQLPTLMKRTFPTELFSINFFDGMHTVIIVQSMLGIIGVVVLYLLTAMLRFTLWERISLAFLIGTHISFISWEHVLVAESMTVPLVLLYAVVVLRLLRKISVFGVFTLCILSIIGLWLKPLYLFLPLLSFPVLFLCWKKRNARAWITGGFLIVLGIVGLQFLANRMYHGYTGFSHVSDINMLGRMLKAGIPPPRTLSLSMYYAPYVNYSREKNDPEPPFHFLDSIDPSIIVDPNFKALEDLHRFVLGSFIASPVAYIRSALLDIPSTLVWKTQESRVSRTAVGRILETLAYAINVISFSILILFPWSIYQVIRAPTRESMTIAFLMGISIAQLVITVMVGYGGYERLMISTIPITCVCVWWYGRNLKFKV